MKVQGKTKQEAICQLRRGEILAAARSVFAEKGFEAATVDEIAERAGLAKGTLYLYFPSKREIYLGAFRDGVMEVVEAARKGMEEANGVYDKLRAFVRIRMQYAEDNRELFKIFHSEFGQITHPAAKGEWFMNIYQEQLEALSTLLEEAARAGMVRNLPAGVAASAIYGMVKGGMLRRILGWSQLSVEEDVEAIWEIAWRGVGAP